MTVDKEEEIRAWIYDKHVSHSEMDMEVFYDLLSEIDSLREKLKITYEELSSAVRNWETERSCQFCLNNEHIRNDLEKSLSKIRGDQ